MKAAQRHGAFGLLAAALLGGCAPFLRGGAGTRWGPVVSVEEVAARLGDPALVILHVDRDRAAYEAGHLPGARFLPFGALVVEREGLPNELPPVAQLDSVFESLGVDDGRWVVLVGPPLLAARAWVTLDLMGFGERAAVLDGGLTAWRAAGRPVTTAEPPPPPRGRWTPRPRWDRVVDAAWVRRHLDDPRVVLVDARPPAQFRGEEAGEGVARPGHIPGARSLFWETLLRGPDDPRLRPPEELRARFEAAGVSPGAQVVAYCRTGVMASVLYLAARALRYDVRLYDGSFVDWSRRPELPVAR